MKAVDRLIKIERIEANPLRDMDIYPIQREKRGVYLHRET